MAQGFKKIGNAEYNIEWHKDMTFECFHKICKKKNIGMDAKVAYKQVTGRAWDEKFNPPYPTEKVIKGLEGLGYKAEDWMRFDPRKPAKLIAKKMNKAAHDKDQERKAKIGKMNPKEYAAHLAGN